MQQKKCHESVCNGRIEAGIELAQDSQRVEEVEGWDNENIDLAVVVACRVNQKSWNMDLAAGGKRKDCSGGGWGRGGSGVCNNAVLLIIGMEPLMRRIELWKRKSEN